MHRRSTYTNLLFVTTLFVAISSSLSQEIFFEMEPCDGFDNSQYITNLRLSFDNIPTSGVPNWITATGYIVKSFYCDSMSANLKFNGFPIWKGTIPEGSQWTGGKEYTRREYLPTKWAAKGNYFGTASAYNEYGETIQCYNYWFYIRGKAGENNQEDKSTHSKKITFGALTKSLHKRAQLGDN